MKPDRRAFLKGGLAAGLGGAASVGRARGDDLDDRVDAEVHRRLRFLSPPDGVAADPEWGLPSRSPEATPFAEPLFVPPTIQPEIDMSAADYRALSDAAWWARFRGDFEALADRLRLNEKLDIGGPPLPEAHQRFWEFRPWRFFVIVEREFHWRFHKDYGDASWCWGFEALVQGIDGKVERRASSPGPVYRARYGQPILVRRINGLPEVGDGPGNARIRFALPSTTTHLHNAHTASESDGFPNDWINPGEYWDHHYANFPSGHDDREKLTSLWYHDHRMDYTAANVYAGLDGFYTLYDETKRRDGRPIPDADRQDVGDEQVGWRLPSGAYDVPLILHDLAFGRDAQQVPQMIFDGFNTGGVLGDQYTVNRKIRPRFEVEARKYRLRIYNGGPSRFYELFLCPQSPSAPEMPMVVCTGDGNFQPNPLLAEKLYLGVAQRADVIVDFSAMKPGDHVYLVNRLKQVDGRGPDGRIVPRPADPKEYEAYLNVNGVMRFDVVAAKGEDPSRIKLTFRDLPPVDLTEVRQERIFEFDEDGGLWTINGRIYDPNRVDARIERDSAEIWTLRNNGRTWHHPIHSHFTEHIILAVDGVPEQQGRVQTGTVPRWLGTFTSSLIDPERLRGAIAEQVKEPGRRAQLLGLARGTHPKVEDARRALGASGPMGDDEARRLAGTVAESLDSIYFDSVEQFRQAAGIIERLLGIRLHVDRFMGGPRRDVVLLLPGSEVKIFMRWRDFLGKFVMHCHNVVHEDHAMMLRWDIVAPEVGSPVPDGEKMHVEPHPGQATGQVDDGRSRTGTP